MDTKNINLKITGRPVLGEDREPNAEDLLEFTTEGTLCQKGGLTRISYEESEISGMAGCTTSILVGPNSVKMTRKGGGLGAGGTVMEFVTGKRSNGLYDTPYGPVPMEIVTNSIVGPKPTERGTKISIDYSLSLHGLGDGRNCLDIEILGYKGEENEKEQN